MTRLNLNGFFSNKFKEAIEAYEKALEIKPDYYEAYYGIGVAYASSNKFKEAIKAYKKAIEIKPSHKTHWQ
jgi:tetratricopeptide (TPR) repeat protein